MAELSEIYHANLIAVTQPDEIMTACYGTTGGMDFEHGKLLAAWLAYHAGGKRWVA